MTKVKVSGTEIPRFEDVPLIKGEGKYTDDFQPDGLTYAAILRSQHPHAKIVSIEVEAAKKIEGVIAVYTSEDLEIDQVPGMFHIKGSFEGQRDSKFSILARGSVRYTGEPIAIVIADDRYVAHEALALIGVKYERLESSGDVWSSMAEDAPIVHIGEGKDNIALDWEYGNKKSTRVAFDDADHIFELEMVNQKLHPDAMEPRSVIAEYSEDTGRVTVRTSTQTPHGIRKNISVALGLSEDRIRVIAPDVGGGFGSKGGSPYVEDPLVVWCSMQLKRPVKWTGRRSEVHHSDHHGRGFFVKGKIAVEKSGKIKGVEFEVVFDIGAYLVWGKTPAANFRHLSSGAYQIPAIYGNVKGVFTNTAPIGPYRGAGRPEAIYAVERVVDHAAREMGMDPVEFRRMNLVPSEAFPYETAVGMTYDSGNYELALDEALEMLDYGKTRSLQKELREENRYIGIGFSTFVENTGTGPSVPESGKIVFGTDGIVKVYCGTADHGQGHKTAFRQILSDKLGVPMEVIEVYEGDSDALGHGVGTFGSRSIAVGASALVKCAEMIIDKSKQIASWYFEAPIEDIGFEDGDFFVVGSKDKSIEMEKIAMMAHREEGLPEEIERGLEAEALYDPVSNAYSFGTHIAVVEVDAESGEVKLERYIAVDDCGVQINPLLVEGQLHGGIVQGIGQALYEKTVYDSAGNLLTGTLQDYALPRTFHIPDIELGSTVTPCPHNPLGSKGAGESGAIAAPPAIVNAVIDALQPWGVKSIDMPITDEVVWQAIKEKKI